jgi:hypothetical protein
MCRPKALNFYLGGTQFESRPGHRLSYLRFLLHFLSLARQMARKYISLTIDC